MLFPLTEDDGRVAQAKSDIEQIVRPMVLFLAVVCSLLAIGDFVYADLSIRDRHVTTIGSNTIVSINIPLVHQFVQWQQFWL